MKNLRKISIFTCLCFLLIYFSILFYVGKQVYFDNRKKSDAILILGAKSYKGDRYNPCLEARVQHGVDLYKNGYANILIMSGGDDEEDKVNESETMKLIAKSKGVPESDIILENKSTSSYENIMYTKKAMLSHNIKSIIIVTEPFHSPRVGLVAKKANIIHSISPTLTSQCWLKWKYGSRFFLREPLAIIQYFFQGKL